MTFTLTRRLLLAAASVSLMTGAALAQDWPTGPVHIVVGFPAGSSPDTLARLIAEPLAARLGQPVVIDNKPGAGGVIGVQQMLNAKNGSTFGVTINGPLTTSARLVPDISYDPATDIAPVVLIATSPLVLAVNADAEPADLQGFIDWARAAERTYGSVGQGSGAHLTAELFSNVADVNMLHIPFQSYAEVTTSILGKEIDAGFMAPSAALPQYQAGKLKLLGITSAEPSAQATDVPVMAGNAGVPDDFRAELWNAVIAPAGTDPAIIERLNKEVNEILQDPTVQDKLLTMGWEARGGTPDELSQRMADDTRVWGTVIDGLKAE